MVSIEMPQQSGGAEVNAHTESLGLNRDINQGKSV